MENKRSIGVTFFGWFYLIINSASILRMLFWPPKKESYFILTLVSCGAFLICGIYLLKLKEIARKAIIILNLIFTACLTFCLLFFSFAIQFYQENNKVVLLLNSLILCSAFIIPIIFFTRPKVKEQFK